MGNGFPLPDLLFGVASVLWAMALIGNRALGNKASVRAVLYLVGLVLVGYGVLRITGVVIL